MFREAQLLSCCKACWDKMEADVFGGKNKEHETCFNFKVGNKTRGENNVLWCLVVKKTDKRIGVASRPSKPFTDKQCF